MLLALFLIFYSSLSWSWTILLDPGHGGEDHGAKSKVIKHRKGRKSSRITVSEKTITLDISKIIRKKLLSLGHSAYLTRSVDKSVSLSQRAELAEKVKADIFVSIHVNSEKSRGPNGFETYYLDNHNDKAVRKVEGVENKDVGGEEKIVNQILIDLVIQRTAPQSKQLSRIVHSHAIRAIKKRFRIKDRGVKPGLFYVLALSKRPSILLEVGFLSHPKEVLKIQGPKFQERLATSIATGIHKYFLKQTR
ncbi:MAG: N-acetylmuramoyl-L-alanine amidase [Bacteriovoracaceae bacterium]|jgi:N-acetylmuramoyl-L-alanine amidase|nr:N-acetylmuramoyl-L-alanine amidase [Bacteriovoracaceae bacterium]